MEKTLILIKPDALQRGLVGEIMHRFERKGLKLLGIKMIHLSDDIVNEWYAHHREKSFFSDLKAYMQWTPVVAIVLEGADAISSVRKIVGITKSREAEAGTIRGDFGMSGQQNLIHASDSVEAATKEIGLIFKKDELFHYKSASTALIYSTEDQK